MYIVGSIQCRAPSGSATCLIYNAQSLGVRARSINHLTLVYSLARDFKMRRLSFSLADKLLRILYRDANHLARFAYLYSFRQCLALTVTCF